MRKLLFPLVCIGLLACQRHARFISGFEGKPMPSFNLLLMDSLTKISTKDIPEGQTTVLFYFSPYCPYCRAETQLLLRDIKSYPKVKFYMISSFPFTPIKKYYKEFQLGQYSNITVGQDFSAYFQNFYKVKGLPYMAVFGKDKHLDRALMGLVGTKPFKTVE